MADDYDGSGWARYIRRAKTLPGWSVARLHRETGIAKSTFFDWMSEDSTKAVTTPYVVAVAKAIGDDPVNAFRAAAGLTGNEPEDADISMVLSSDLSDVKKDELIEILLGRRQQDRDRRMEDTAQLIRVARGEVA